MESFSRRARAVLALALSMAFAITLALVFIAAASAAAHRSMFELPGVMSVAMYSAVIIGLGLAPLSYWSLRTGRKKLLRYAPPFWLFLAVVEAALTFVSGVGAVFAVVIFAAAGLNIFGLFPARTN
jgi:hypothetical protein